MRASPRPWRASRRCPRPPRPPARAHARPPRPARHRTATARRAARRRTRCRRPPLRPARGPRSVRPERTIAARSPARRPCAAPRAREPRNAVQKTIVAAAKQPRDLASALDRAPVEPEIGKLRPSDRADDRHVRDLSLASARRIACRLRQAAARHAGTPRSRRSAEPTMPIRKSSRPAARASRARLQRKGPRRRRGSRAAAAAASAGPARFKPLRPCRRAACRSRDRRPRAGTPPSAAPPPPRGTRRRHPRRAPSTFPRREQHLVGAAQVVNRLVRKAAPLQADEIQARRARRDCPSAMPNGMMSFSTPARPPTKACAPMRTN